MKNATTYAKKIRRLYSKIKGEAQKDPPVEVKGSTETLLMGILSRPTTQKKAAEALSRLNESTVDLNELRVTPVAEMVQIIGVGYPSVRPVCEEISQVLTAIFNQTHELDLTFLKALGKKAAAAFLDSLDGLGQHANAYFMLHALNSAAVPLDESAHDYLVKTNHLPEGTDLVEAHRFLRTHFKESESGPLSTALKLHARSPAGRKEMKTAASEPAPAASASRARPTTSKKKAARKPRPAKSAAPRTASKARTASKKKTSKKTHR